MFSRREHGVGILASSNTIFGSPVSQKVNDFINTSGSFRRRLIPKTIGSPIQTHLHLRTGVDRGIKQNLLAARICLIGHPNPASRLDWQKR
jgi:hypothetical protein